jgi:geranylgeranylglycerol-phosphate geranylgeranyltransferase
MYAVGVVIGIVISTGLDIEVEKVIFGVFTAIFLQAAAFALNDYCDYEVDLKNNRVDRPLVRGDLSKNTALLSFAMLTPIGFTSAYMIGFEAFLLAFLITIAGFFYDVKLKEFGIAGNIYIGFTMAAPFLFGNVVATGTVELAVAVLASMAFLSGIAREIMKGIEDIEGDSLRNVRTVARLRGVDIAGKYSGVVFIISVLLSPIPFFAIHEFFFDFKYIIPVLVTDMILLRLSLRLLRGHFTRESISKFRKQTLIAMSIGLVGFLAGAF